MRNETTQAVSPVHNPDYWSMLTAQTNTLQVLNIYRLPELCCVPEVGLIELCCVPEVGITSSLLQKSVLQHEVHLIVPIVALKGVHPFTLEHVLLLPQLRRKVVTSPSLLVSFTMVHCSLQFSTVLLPCSVGLGTAQYLSAPPWGWFSRTQK